MGMLIIVIKINIIPGLVLLLTTEIAAFSVLLSMEYHRNLKSSNEYIDEKLNLRNTASKSAELRGAINTFYMWVRGLGATNTLVNVYVDLLVFTRIAGTS